MSARTFTVRIEHTGDTPEAFDRLFTQYLTDREGAFFADYGPEAWGGYEGPFVTKVTVTPT